MTTSDHTLLLVVDVQNDFLDGGPLAVPDGEAIIPVLNGLIPRFDHVALTQDWHPPGHISFASSHPQKRPFDTTTLSYGEQVLWPDHCIQGTAGAEFHTGLDARRAHFIVRKGYHHDIDSYSALYAADRRTPTGLAGYLRERGFSHLVLAGLATDYCVRWSAIDARQAGFAVSVVADACRGIDLDGSLDAAWRDMEEAGVVRITSEDIP